MKKISFVKFPKAFDWSVLFSDFLGSSEIANLYFEKFERRFYLSFQKVQHELGLETYSEVLKEACSVAKSVGAHTLYIKAVDILDPFIVSSAARCGFSKADTEDGFFKVVGDYEDPENVEVTFVIPVELLNLLDCYREEFDEDRNTFFSKSIEAWDEEEESGGERDDYC